MVPVVVLACWEAAILLTGLLKAAAVAAVEVEAQAAELPCGAGTGVIPPVSG